MTKNEDQHLRWATVETKKRTKAVGLSRQFRPIRRLHHQRNPPHGALPSETRDGQEGGERDGDDYRGDECPELWSGSEGDETGDETESDDTPAGQTNPPETECKGQLGEGCPLNDFWLGEAHPF